MKRSVLLVFLITLTFSVRAQRTCATTEVNQLNKSTEQIQIDQAAFEEWLVLKRAQIVSQTALQSLSETIVYQIPVVVHIIHDGEAYGQGFNITDEQIAAQIAVLSRDFRHLNADSVNTPAIFQPLMADIGFEFVLAKRDPNGLPTNGITRTDGNQSIWSFGENDELKALSYWSTDDYFNLWVAPLGTTWLGWSEFPTSEIIDGVNEVAKDNALTDGVVINSLAFGSEELYPQGNYKADFNLGRTTTHEVGHFFGLRHVWGDGGCTVDDFVSDTPKTDGAYYNCPSAGTLTNSCNAEESMFMNYMDYVDDACMNLFSLGQKGRMVIVVNNSPRRASLLTSLALEPPPPLDAAITALPSPGIGICDGHIFPSVTVQNTGITTVTEVKLSLSINQAELGQQTYPVSLIANQDTTLYLADFVLPQYGSLDLTVELLSVNAQIDDLSGNNIFAKQIFYSETVTTLNEDFSTWPQSWAVRTDAPVSQWNFLQAPNVIIENTAAVLSYYENNSPFPDHLISPSIDLSSYAKPYILFDYAYGEVPGADDILAVIVSLDCGNTFQDTLLLKSGSALATTEIPVRFTPSGPIDWQTEMLDLSDYVIQMIQIAFVGRSEGGNNIYLDNFLLVDEGYEDISIKGLLNESAAYSSTISSLGLIVENTGATIVNNLEIEVSEDTQLVNSQVFNNLNLMPGQRQVISLDNIFTAGVHNLKFNHLLNDAVPENNYLSASTNFLANKEYIPFREKFNAGTWNDINDWTISSPIDDNKWQIWPVTTDNIFYPAYSQGNIGLHDWLVLPMFDFSNTNVAAIQYKIAYASNDLNNELLRVWVSINEGESFDYLIETLTGEQMATHHSVSEWNPAAKNDWQDSFIDLSEFAGEENVLIAFEAIDGDGNNIYLDDIELFVANEPNMIEIEEDKMAVYPNPITDIYSRISFNLNEKQDVNIRIIDVTGNAISNQKLTNVLNQTYPLALGSHRSGIYIIQATGVSFNDVIRILVSN
jgi:hypothetical protein